MPLYEYQCHTCKKVSEQIESVKEAKEVVKCPECGRDAFKIISITSFKVNGFNEANGYSASDST